MDSIKIQQLNKASLDLFSDATKAFASSSSEKLRSQSKSVPTKFVDDDKKLESYLWGSTVLVSLLFCPF